MTRPGLIAGIFLLLALASAGVPAGAATDLELVVIVNLKNSVSSLSRDELEALFTLSRQRWSNGDPVIVLNLEPGSGPRTHFDRVVLGMAPDEAARFWIDRRIRGRGNPPTKAPNPVTALKVVAALTGAISYVPKSQLGPGVKVVARVTRDFVVPEKQGASR
jgi:ABC-type phosphate transport system substrate-binding protein